MEKQNELHSETVLLTQRDQKTLAVLIILLCLWLAPSVLNCSSFIDKNFDKNRKRDYIFQIDINSADTAELQLLPGIGEKLSQNIVSYRQENGRFYRHNELQNIRGIGSKKLAAISPFLAEIPFVSP